MLRKTFLLLVLLFELNKILKMSYLLPSDRYETFSAASSAFTSCDFLHVVSPNARYRRKLLLFSKGKCFLMQKMMRGISCLRRAGMLDKCRAYLAKNFCM